MNHEQLMILGAVALVGGLLMWSFVFMILHLNQVTPDTDYARQEQVINFLNQTEGGDWSYNSVFGYYADSLTDRVHRDD